MLGVPPLSCDALCDPPNAPPELHRCAVFLLLQVGAEIHDTPTVLVDRTLTDICFEGAVLL